MFQLRRAAFGVVGLLIASLTSGCIVKCNGREGLCFKPLFRMRFELNRNNGDNIDDRGGWRSDRCPCEDGGHGGPQFMGDGLDQGGVVGGPLTVDSQALPLDGDFGSPVMEGSGPVNAKPIYDPNDPALLLPHGAQPPQMAPVPQGQSVGAPPTGANNQSQQTAKKKPGSLRLGANLMMPPTNVLKVGERALFSVDVDNSGETPIDTTKLEALFSDNLLPVSVNRREGSSFANVALQSSANARIDGQKVLFDEIRNLGSETKIQFQIVAEVRAGAESGSFEVTASSSALGGTPVKKSVPVTVNPK